jgi:hypothetical protein
MGLEQLLLFFRQPALFNHLSLSLPDY